MSARSLALVPVAVFLAACADVEPTAPRAAPEHAAFSAGVGEHGVGAPQSIAFHSDRAGNREIYLMNPDGTDPVRLTFRPQSSDFYPDISTNRKWIVFTSAIGSGPGDIYLVSADGGDAINLTNTPAADENWARWSPDGRQIAFHGQDESGNYDLYLLDLDSRQRTRLTTYAGVDMWPEWSPNGKQLALRRDHDVYVLELRDGSTRQLTTVPALDQMAAWSPNGKQLAFMSLREGYCSVFIMDADGSNQQNLTPGAMGWCSRAPSWTRDGRIVFMSVRPGTLGPAAFVMNADGTGLALLTDEPGEDGGPTAP